MVLYMLYTDRGGEVESPTTRLIQQLHEKRPALPWQNEGGADVSLQL